MSDSHHFTVHTQWSSTRILMVVMSVLGIGAAVAATLTARDLRSSAQVDRPSPTPFAISTSVPSPAINLKTPFVRLTSGKTSYGFSTVIPVDVYLHSGGAATIENYLVLSYNPDLLELNKDDIKNENVYKVIDTVLDEPGKAKITLFVNTQVGHTPVTLDTESKILTLQFKSKTLKADSTQIKIEYDKKNLELSTLTEYSETRKDTPVNLLNSAEGLILSILP